MSQFIYLLNALENAAQADDPFRAGYPEARKKLLEYVAKLEGKWEAAGDRCPQCGTGIAFARPEALEIPEGCTPADAAVLREANGMLAEENHQLRRTLRFYAHGEHHHGLKHWEGPSGDDNWLCAPSDDFMNYRKEFIDGLDEAMVEDGSLARAALRGVYLDMEGEDELSPVEGEPEWKIEQEAKRLETIPSPLARKGTEE